jgi:hypothetical protein
VLIIDDPHSEQEAAMAASNPDIYDKVYEWYTSGPASAFAAGRVDCYRDDTLGSSEI